MCVYVYVYVYMCTYMCAFTYINTHTHTYICVYVYEYVCMGTYVCIYIYINTYFMSTYIYVLNFPIFCAIWLKKCDFLTEKLGIKPDPDPKLFIPDPDPSKSSGSDWIRIHNTAVISLSLLSSPSVLLSSHCLSCRIKLQTVMS